MTCGKISIIFEVVKMNLKLNKMSYLQQFFKITNVTTCHNDIWNSGLGVVVVVVALRNMSHIVPGINHLALAVRPVFSGHFAVGGWVRCGWSHHPPSPYTVWWRCFDCFWRVCVSVLSSYVAIFYSVENLYKMVISNKPRNDLEDIVWNGWIVRLTSA